ncbi:hypothetical protein [Alloprevotella rava]|uniref:Uncharacterized protein n=1 Tax=Alloprevotella rava TaxID=671218 RepID=A0A7W5UEQ6_9BACT|nr:hypothetical protein [Alloprevotella rava]MBB3702764.1 hypothetical protein [Alloprevotella rava]
MMKTAPQLSPIFPRRREKETKTSKGRLSSFLAAIVQAKVLVSLLLLLLFANPSGTVRATYTDSRSAQWSTAPVHSAAPREQGKEIPAFSAPTSGRNLSCILPLAPTDTTRCDSSEVGAHSTLTVKQQPNSQTAERTLALRNGTTAYNVSPISWDVYQYIGRETTFITDREAITDILGNICEQMSISTQEATCLETALGLKKGSLQKGFKIREIYLTGMPPERIRVPERGNKHFLGKGKGLPGGGPELELQPRISTKDNAEVRTIATVSILKLF